jgi:tRNA (guanine-N7-)-methyltransferase
MKTNPYAHAPRLPEGESTDPRLLVGAVADAIELEIGPGRGGFMFERLDADPSVRILGLEIRRKWATLVDERLRAKGLGERARVLAEDAKSALPRFPEGCARAVFVHFPDPWWKKRHHKRLVVTPELLAQVCRVLRSGGELFIQTDVSERAQAYAELLAAEPRLHPIGAAPPFVEENPFGARSPREHRAIADGLPIYRLHFRRA